MTTQPPLQQARIFTAGVPQEGKWHVAACPEIGTVSQGKTEAEAVANLKEATALYLEEFDPPADPSLVVQFKLDG